MSSTSNDNEGHERRVASILSSARREVGVRDLLVFSCARMWTVVLAIGAVVYGLCTRWCVRHSNEQHGTD
jgi:hypothetical protein